MIIQVRSIRGGGVQGMGKESGVPGHSGGAEALREADRTRV